MNSFNLIIFLISLLSIVAVTIFIERFIFLKKSEKDLNELILNLRKAIEEGNRVEAIRLCEETQGPIAQVLKAGLLKTIRSKEVIESAMEVQGLIEIAELEKRSKILSIIATLAPLIGLLGTVLGFIQAFQEMRLSGLVDISAAKIGEAMEFALITTALGLVVAIPCIVAYNYIVSRIESFTLDMQTTSSEIVDLLVYRDEI
ncbi:MAG: MotA/TolQ/ExbB proton channel family protein [Parachlamydiaceae bacterium]